MTRRTVKEADVAQLIAATGFEELKAGDIVCDSYFQPIDGDRRTYQQNKGVKKEFNTVAWLKPPTRPVPSPKPALSQDSQKKTSHEFVPLLPPSSLLSFLRPPFSPYVRIIILEKELALQKKKTEEIQKRIDALEASGVGISYMAMLRATAEESRKVFLPRSPSRHPDSMVDFGVPNFHKFYLKVENQIRNVRGWKKVDLLALTLNWFRAGLEYSLLARLIARDPSTASTRVLNVIHNLQEFAKVMSKIITFLVSLDNFNFKTKQKKKRLNLLIFAGEHLPP